VERLTRHNEVDASGPDARILCPPRGTPEPRSLAQQILSCEAHGSIGLDREHAVAVVEKGFGGKSGARSDVRDDPGGL
jgi:hypothetical protein